MVRLSRAEQQERTRAAVVAAAREEFAVHGFADARIDRITERSGFTRGALYANFPSKRALYLAVLLDLERGEDTAPMETGLDLADLVEGFARVWLERLPLTSDDPPAAHLRLRSLSGVFDIATPHTTGRPSPTPPVRGAPPAAYASASPQRGAAASMSTDAAMPAGGNAAPSKTGGAEPSAAGGDESLAGASATGRAAGGVAAPAEGSGSGGGVDGPREAAAAERAALAGVARLEGLLLGLALETRAPGRRLVRMADVVRTLLDGACHRAEIAPGVGDAFDVVRACRQLASLDLGEVWEPPHQGFVRPATETGAVWDPPGPIVDLAEGGEVDLRRWDGLVVVLGTGRLGAAEEAVRSGEAVALVVVTERPADLGALVRLRVADMAGCLRRLAEPRRGDPGQGEPAWGDPARGGWAKGEETWGDPARGEGARGEGTRGNPVRGEGATAAPFRVVVDEDGSIARALGVAARDQVEVAVRVRGREVLARADGRGAALAVTDGRGAR
ncbi:TetR/AcrR family transcriptional regulator [Actinoplanes sp. NPDC049265]|uniref:TetR/AcrR family transcriptional regulator n=1 Tax=Actinoplanes sp. NPDC049265 TaxID=3363902 RepID=UPI003710A6A4